jgi:2-oxoglutarate dehydrogenase E2 component (dihydrolipoamide succinyltransferase)
MLIEVKVPVLPESVTEATLVNWHKKAGDAVKRDENLVDVETDKVVLELPAPGSGVVTEIRKPDGATVAAQEVIAVIDTDAKGASAAEAATAAPAAAAPAAASAPAVTASPQAAAAALPTARKLMA